jgi:hypothetical protein
VELPLPIRELVFEPRFIWMQILGYLFRVLDSFFWTKLQILKLSPQNTYIFHFYTDHKWTYLSFKLQTHISAYLLVTCKYFLTFFWKLTNTIFWRRKKLDFPLLSRGPSPLSTELVSDVPRFQKFLLSPMFIYLSILPNGTLLLYLVIRERNICHCKKKVIDNGISNLLELLWLLVFRYL